MKAGRKKTDAARAGALEKTEKMIRKLISLFDTFESDEENRNHCLHRLRALNKKIETSSRIEEIKALYNDAKDLFVDVIEEVQIIAVNSPPVPKRRFPSFSKSRP